MTVVPNAVPGVEYEYRVQEIVDELRQEDRETGLLEEKQGKIEGEEKDQLTH